MKTSNIIQILGFFPPTQNSSSCCTVKETLTGAFDIHMSVHRNYNSKLEPTRCNVSWFIYFYRRFTCFRRLLCPSSGAHNCTCIYSFRYCQPILLLAGVVDKMERRWAGEPPETCRASVEINKSRNVVSCWLYFGIRILTAAFLHARLDYESVLVFSNSFAKFYASFPILTFIIY